MYINLFPFGYLILTEIITWIRDNDIKHVYEYTDDASYFSDVVVGVYFIEIEDAIAFKLRFAV